MFESIKAANARRAFNSKREAFYRDLAEALDDDESVAVFLERRRDFSYEQGQKGQASLYERMLSRMEEEEGRLSHMLETVVSDSDLMSLRANDSGKDTNALTDGLRALALAIKKSKVLRKIIVMAVISPAIAFPIVIALPLFIFFAFIPEYTSMSNPQDWGLWGRTIYWQAYVVTHYGIFIGIALIAAVYWHVWSYRNWTGMGRKVADRYLPYSIYRRYVSAYYLESMAQVTRKGEGLLTALEDLQEKASPYLASHIKQTLDRLFEEPNEYGKAFDTGLFDPDIHLRLVTYAERGKGNFEQALVRLGTDGIEYLQESIERTGQVIGFLSLVLVFLVMFFYYGGNYVINRDVTELMEAGQTVSAAKAPKE